MTKFILVGGYTSKAADGGRAFAEELTSGFGGHIKLLDCLFARSRDSWEKAFNQDKEFFAKHLSDRVTDIQLADPERFIEQLRWADVVYIRGGESDKLKDVFSRWPGWEKELSDKTLAGSSAGANMIAQYFYGLDDLGIHTGQGLLPLKVLVHYRSDYNAPHIDWDKAEEELKNYKEDLPLVTLQEGKFKVFTQ